MFTYVYALCAHAEDLADVMDHAAENSVDNGVDEEELFGQDPRLVVSDSEDQRQRARGRGRASASAQASYRSPAGSPSLEPSRRLRTPDTSTEPAAPCHVIFATLKHLPCEICKDSSKDFRGSSHLNLSMERLMLACL